MSEEKSSKKLEREKRIKKRSRRNWIAVSLIAIIAIVGIGSGIMISQALQREELIVYSGAGMREPMDEIGKVFQNEHNVAIKYTYGGSNTLLSQIELYQEGDVYMPGATSYIQSAMDKGFINQTVNIAYHIPIIAVPEGNPKNIQSLEDLARDDVEVVFGDPEAAAIGKLGKKILQEQGLWEDVEDNVISWGATVNELVFWIAQGQGDASIIWKSSLVGTEDKTDYVVIPESQNMIKIIPIGTLMCSEKCVLAQTFINFVANEGKEIFEKHGFEPYYEGQTLDIYSARMNMCKKMTISPIS